MLQKLEPLMDIYHEYHAHHAPTSTSIYHTHIVLRSFILNETKTLESGPLPPQTLRGISKNSDFIKKFFTITTPLKEACM